MRALARDLKLSQSYVSEILSGKKKLPTDSLGQWFKALSIDSIGRRDLESALVNELLRRPSVAAFGENGEAWAAQGMQNHDLLRKWFYVVLLDLITCSDFKNDISWISKRMGIDGKNVSEAIRLLVDLGYAKKSANGELKKSQKKMRFATTRSLGRVRDFHRQMIQLSLQELLTKTQPADFEKRLISGITFACNPQNIPKAKQRLAEAMHEVAEILMQGECTDVFQLNTQLFSHLR